MPEAVIVAHTRSPIGRAMKGSLKDIRADDLLAQVVESVLADVPALDREELGDLILGCGLPGGEQGWNMARRVAVQLGMDSLPGTTITRYCSSSLQSTRMAFHAIKAGEGTAYISAGVESVSSFVRGSSDHFPGTENPLFDTARERTAARKLSNVPWSDPREDGLVPDVYLDMGETAENVASLTGNRGHTSRRDGGLGRRLPAVRYDVRSGLAAEAGVPRGGIGHRGQLLPAQRRCGRTRDHVGRPGA